MLDRRTGKIIGSENMDETNTTASMIKAWIAADYLRRAAEAGQTPSDARLADAHTIDPGQRQRPAPSSSTTASAGPPRSSG